LNAEFSEKARAKLNLTLDVREKTDDGYHRIVTVFQTVDFGDEITFRPGDGPLTAKTDLPFLPTGDKNLAVRAAQLFFRETGVAPMGGVIGIKKNIPVCGGLAGGSSDAAAVLRLLNRACGTGLSVSELEKLSEQLGSDVPFCVAGGTVLGEGRGEKMTRLRAMPECGVVILRPDFASSTPELFKAIDSLRVVSRPDTAGMLRAIEEGSLTAVARRVFNIFEAALPRRWSEKVDEAKDVLLENGALGACMSGTGSAVYGLFADVEAASEAASRIKGFACFATKTSPALD
jgi:4-diphosphocytidyl-2-C-methyl-D-erythritol kinase